ncbi:hypothetical protein [Maribacter aurantiacus]|nr:hypothetical protein [Maribacter aurantiacus]
MDIRLMELIKVKQGKRLQFINNEYEHFMEVFQVTDRPEQSENGYKIRLNGELVGDFRTYPPFSKECKTLIKDYKLEEY